MAKVLVVDDQATNRELVVTLLRHLGHEPLEAADGMQALSQVRQHAPGLVICDLVMPGMDGYEFVRQLRSDSSIAQTEVVFHTATFRENEARSLARSCGVTHVLVKPCEPELFMQTIQEVLGQGSVPPPAALALGADFDREHTRLLADKLAAKVGELEAANLRLAALTRLSLQLSSERDPHQLLDKVCHGARELLGGRYALLVASFGSGSDARYTTSAGLPPDALAQLANTDLEAWFRATFPNPNAHRLASTAHAPACPGLPAGLPQTGCAVAAELVSTNQRYGWLLVADRLDGSRAFSEEDERLLRIVAAQAGRIYESGHLYLDVRHSEERLRREAVERKRAVQALRESERRFADMLGNVKLASVMLDRDMRITYVNDFLLTLTGWSRPELLGRNWFEAMGAAHDAARTQSVFEAVLEGRPEGAHHRDEIVTRARERRLVQWSNSVLRTATGAAIGVASIGEDITERHRAEDRIRRLNRIYEVLSGINSLIVRVSSQAELFQESCRIAVEDGRYQRAWISLREAGSERCSLVAGHGQADDQVDRVVHGLGAAPGGGELPVHRALRTLQPVISNDIAADAQLAPLHAEVLGQGLRSLACFPLVVNGVSVGVFTLCSSELEAFDTAEVRLLEDLAGDISFAFDHLQKVDRLHYLAYYDALTGLANSTLLNERLEQGIVAARAEQQMLALAIIDLERFKDVNHSIGRHAGDALLQQVAQRLTRGSGSRHQLARTGSDHFAMLLHDVKDIAEVGRFFADNYNQWFGSSFLVADQELRVAARIGIGVYPGDGQDAETLFRNAEAAAKKAKASSQRWLFYDARMTLATSERLALENQLRQAVEREEFLLHYQPKVAVDSRRLEGLEALLRWNSPTQGLVAPNRFIPLLEETGLILEVGLWVVRRAALDSAAWRSRGLAPPRIAVNVSAVQLQEADFATALDHAARGAEATHNIDIELTESLVMEDVEANTHKLQALRDLGFQLAIDDFGTGYSSLAYLSKLPAEVLKIDRAFIASMLEDPDNLTLVATMISLAHSLRLKVVAEGVETEEQAKMLRLLRCDQMQGYLTGAPVAFDRMTELLRSSLPAAA